MKNNLATAGANVEIIEVRGRDVENYLNDVARLRIQIFREFPYLYDGSMDYEKDYLSVYSQSEESLMVLAIHGQEIVGVSTSVPLKDEMVEIQAPFAMNDLNINDFFYLGESVLLPAYRGQGIYKYFFSLREKAARSGGYRFATFLAVDRPFDHPLKPVDYQPMEPVWKHFGYAAQPQLKTVLTYQQIDSPQPQANEMMFRLKEL